MPSTPILRKRNPRHLSLFDLPSHVRARIYASYFTYPHGLHLHLVYSGHFPRPVLPRSSRSRVTDDRLVLTEDGGDDEDNEGEGEDGEDGDWPFPTEAQFDNTKYLFATRRFDSLPLVAAVEQTERLYEATRESPTEEMFPGRVSTRKRLRDGEGGVEMGASLEREYRVEAALLRSCKAVWEEARGCVWRENKVYLVTGPKGGEGEDREDWPRDGRYHLHLGVVPQEVLRGVRELVLPVREVVRELPSQSARPGDLVVQRRVWEVVEREMPGLRKLEVEAGGVEDVEEFLGWVVGEMGNWRGRAVVEAGQVKEMGRTIRTRNDLARLVVVPHRKPGVGSNVSTTSADVMTGKMVIPRDVRVISVRLLLQKELWTEFEKLRWGDIAPVMVGRKKSTTVHNGGVVAWDAAVFEMRVSKGERKPKQGEGQQGKVHDVINKAAKGKDATHGRRDSLTDRVYEKLRLKQ